MTVTELLAEYGIDNDDDTFTDALADTLRQVPDPAAAPLAEAATTYLADLKRQFADKADHLGMVGTVLESLIYRQRPRPEPGSERNPRGP